jgi:hypothetical protein
VKFILLEILKLRVINLSALLSCVAIVGFAEIVGCNVHLYQAACEQHETKARQ